jgi:hypothetical protein
MAEGYCKPLSVKHGGAIEFKISAGAPYDVVFERLRVESDGIGPARWTPARVTAVTIAAASSRRRGHACR